MIGEGFLADNIIELAGLFVTIAGVWFVVQQLREAKLASQMEGVIAIQQMERKHIKSAKPLYELLETDEWQDLDGEEAYSMINNTDAYWDGYLEYVATYGLLGNLVRAKAIHIHLAYEQWGFFVPSRWRALEKFTFMLREKMGTPTLNDNWEWLAIEFGKMSK